MPYNVRTILRSSMMRKKQLLTPKNLFKSNLPCLKNISNKTMDFRYYMHPKELNYVPKFGNFGIRT